MSAVCAEIELAAAACSAHKDASRAPPQPLQTVFFGGGTPSLLPPEQLSRILTSLRRSFGIADGAEISVEMDPGAPPDSLCDGRWRLVPAACALRPAWLSADCSLSCPPPFKGTFDRAKLDAFLELGVSRINMGIQTFSQEALEGAGVQLHCGSLQRTSSTEASMPALWKPTERPPGPIGIKGAESPQLPRLRASCWPRTQC